MKHLTLLLTILFLSVIQVEQAEAQKTDLKHTFRIVDKNRIPFNSREAMRNDGSLRYRQY